MPWPIVVKNRYGNEVSLNEVVNLEDGIAFSDISGHWAEGDIELMSQLKIALPRDAGSQGIFAQ